MGADLPEKSLLPAGGCAGSTESIAIDHNITSDLYVSEGTLEHGRMGGQHCCAICMTGLRRFTLACAVPLAPQVAALCAILDKDLSDRRTTTEVDVDPLVSASYTSLFSQEVERRLKQASASYASHSITKASSASESRTECKRDRCLCTSPHSTLTSGALGVL